MKPYYQDDAVTIYQGDMRELSLWDGTGTQAIVTDPPYGTGYYGSDTDPLTPDMLIGFYEAAQFVAVFGWPEPLIRLCIAASMSPDEWVTWWPTNARSRGFNKQGLWREVECIATWGLAEWGVLRQPRKRSTTPFPLAGLRGKPQTDLARQGDVWIDESPNLNPNQPPRLHPNEKPVSVMARLIHVTAAREIVDPFMGSGTTLVAAKALGRRAIGVEINERWCEVAANRCRQDTLGLSG